MDWKPAGTTIASGAIIIIIALIANLLTTDYVDILNSHPDQSLFLITYSENKLEYLTRSYTEGIPYFLSHFEEDFTKIYFGSDLILKNYIELRCRDGTLRAISTKEIGNITYKDQINRVIVTQSAVYYSNSTKKKKIGKLVRDIEIYPSINKETISFYPSDANMDCQISWVNENLIEKSNLVINDSYREYANKLILDWSDSKDKVSSSKQTSTGKLYVYFGYNKGIQIIDPVITVKESADNVTAIRNSNITVASANLQVRIKDYNCFSRPCYLYTTITPDIAGDYASCLDLPENSGSVLKAEALMETNQISYIPVCVNMTVNNTNSSIFEINISPSYIASVQITVCNRTEIQTPVLDWVQVSYSESLNNDLKEFKTVQLATNAHIPIYVRYQIKPVFGQVIKFGYCAYSNNTKIPLDPMLNTTTFLLDASADINASASFNYSVAGNNITISKVLGNNSFYQNSFETNASFADWFGAGPDGGIIKLNLSSEYAVNGTYALNDTHTLSGSPSDSYFNITVTNGSAETDNQLITFEGDIFAIGNSYYGFGNTGVPAGGYPLQGKCYEFTCSLTGTDFWAFYDGSAEINLGISPPCPDKWWHIKFQVNLSNSTADTGDCSIWINGTYIGHKDCKTSNTGLCNNVTSWFSYHAGDAPSYYDDFNIYRGNASSIPSGDTYSSTKTVVVTNEFSLSTNVTQWIFNISAVVNDTVGVWFDIGFANSSEWYWIVNASNLTNYTSTNGTKDRFKINFTAFTSDLNTAPVIRGGQLDFRLITPYVDTKVEYGPNITITPPRYKAESMTAKNVAPLGQAATCVYNITNNGTASGTDGLYVRLNDTLPTGLVMKCALANYTVANAYNLTTSQYEIYDGVIGVNEWRGVCCWVDYDNPTAGKRASVLFEIQ